MKTIKHIKYYILLSVSIYFIVYMVRAFCSWDFTHPFKWIINIPKMDMETRSLLLFGWAIYSGVKNIAIAESIKQKEK